MAELGIPYGQDADKIAQELQDAILEGYSENFKKEFLRPSNIGPLERADSYVRITGPCGDTVEMWLAVERGKISDIGFMTDGCGATITCASYVTRTAKGKPLEAAYGITAEDVIAYFEGLPEEHKHCAKLAAMTLAAAIDKYRSETGK
ncbi:MAG: iron-sulfur cluster assembly scaffold protein [Sedimentisphaerales bacterium]|nr:iron-sulfur cluster assembly scaffold protein [Sedimentisphaerales bacterium]